MMEVGERKNTLASKFRSVYNKARAKIGKQKTSNPTTVAGAASSPPNIVAPVPTTPIANTETTVARAPTEELRIEERHEPRYPIPIPGTITQGPSDTDIVASNEKWKNVPAFRKAAKRFEEEYKELSEAIAKTTSLCVQGAPKGLQNAPGDVQSLIQRCKPYLPSLSTVQGLAVTLSRLDPHGIAPLMVNSVFFVVQLSIGVVNPEVREKALTILSKTSANMNKWVIYEYTLARNIAAADSDEINRLEDDLSKLYIESFKTIGTIYHHFRQSGSNLISQSQMPEFERRLSELDRLDRGCTSIKDQIDSDLKADEGVRELIRWIKDKIDPEPSHETIIERTGLWNDSLAADWFLRTPQFTSLENKLSHDEDGQILWLNGMMGSGKTTLICRIISHFQHVPIPGLRIVHYYCYGSTTSDSNRGISYQNIVRGLCSKLVWNNDSGDLWPCARDFYKRCHLIEGERTPTAGEWKQLLKDLVSESRTLLIIDALDECRLPDRNDFLNTIRDLRKTQCLNIIFSSRQHVEAKTFFGHDFVNYPIVTDGARDDMSKFIDKKIFEIKADPVRSNSILFKNKDLDERLVDALNNHAGGMFRWVEVWLGVLFPLDHDPLAQSDVAKSKLEILESAPTLNNLSDEADLMKQAYQQLWDTNARDDRRRCHQIRLFQFLLGALGPVSPDMLLEAIRFNPERPKDYTYELDLFYIEKLYHNFLSTKIGHLAFEHVSAKTFILELVTPESTVPLFADEALNHAVIATSSLLLLRDPDHPIWNQSAVQWKSYPTTLSQDELENLRCSSKVSSIPRRFYWSHCLATYIIEFWHQHCSKLKGSEKDLEIFHLWLDIFKHFLTTLKCLYVPYEDNVRHWSETNEYDFDRSLVEADNKVMVSPLMFTLNFGMSPFYCHHMLSDIAESLGNIMVRNLKGGTALHVAVRQDDLISVRALLEISLQKDPDRKLLYSEDWWGRNALHLARSEDVVQALLQFEARVLSFSPTPGEIPGQSRLLNSKDKEDDTPILHIIENFSQEFVLSIIGGSHATFDHITHEQGLALWEVTIERGFKEVAKLFLKHADSNVARSRESALMLAAAGDRIDMAGFLLSQGADIDAINWELGTALGIAIYEQNLQMATFLLCQGANIDAAGGELGTPLGNAVYRGDPKGVTFLLSQGANINATGGKYGTALGVAVAQGDDTDSKVLNLLLKGGTVVDAVGGSRGKSLRASISRSWTWPMREFRRYKADIDLAILEWPDRESWTTAGELDPVIASAWARYESNCSDGVTATDAPS